MSSRKTDPETATIGPPLQSFDCEPAPITRGRAVRTRGGTSRPATRVRGAAGVRASADELLRSAAALPLAQRLRLVKQLLDGLPPEEQSRLANALRQGNSN